MGSAPEAPPPLAALSRIWAVRRRCSSTPGDGVVFKGAVGPWYSGKGDFHLSREAAKEVDARADATPANPKYPVEPQKDGVSFAEYGDVIRVRRVPYDVDATARKIYAIPELDNFLGDRLRQGR